jgi:hypothetical protein
MYYLVLLVCVTRNLSICASPADVLPVRALVRGILYPAPRIYSAKTKLCRILWHRVSTTMGRKPKLCDSEWILGLAMYAVQVCGVGGQHDGPGSGQIDDSRKAQSAHAPPYKVLVVREGPGG